MEPHADPPGVIVFVADERRLLVRDASGWSSMEDLLASPSQLGIARPRTSNRLAVASPGVLFTHAGDNLRVSVNQRRRRTRPP